MALPVRNLRIALILETSGGGSGRHVLDLARGLLRRGHRVCVIWSPVRVQEDFVAQLRAEAGIESLPLDMHRAVGPRDLQSLRALTALLRRRGPFDVLHGHSSKAGALVRLLPRRLPGVRVYTPHAFRTMDPDLGWGGRLIYGGAERLLAARAARIITVSGAERDHALALGLPASKLAVVVNGGGLAPRANRSDARTRMGLGADEVAVGFVGRLDDQKDPLRFVAAVAQAARIAPAVRGVVIGDGALRVAAESAAAPGVVRFLGWQDAARLFPGLDIFCMTSRYEAMPYTLIEALHAGVPIVTTDVGGAAETVQEGRNGLVLPRTAPAHAFAEVLGRLATDTPLRRRLAAQSLQKATARTVDAMVEDTLGVYADAL